MNTQFFSKNVIALISLVMMFTFSSCSYEDLSVNDITKECQIQEARLKQQEDAYSKALKKIPSLYGATLQDGHKRMSSGNDMPDIVDAYPLWYSDTSIVIGGDPFGPGIDDPQPPIIAANDSIYAYVFNFANDQGSMVVGVDENLPDLLVYSKGRDFIKEPIPIRSISASKFRFYLRIAQMYAQREAMIRQMIADLCGHFRQHITESTKNYHRYVDESGWQDVEWGDEDFHLPPLVKKEFDYSWTCVKSASYEDKEGKCELRLMDTVPFTNEIQSLMHNRTYCWDIIPTIAMYLSTMQDVSTYSDWNIDWKKYLEQTNPTQSDEDEFLQKIQHLYYLLCLPENLYYYYSGFQTFTTLKKVPAILEKFGFSNGGYANDRPYFDGILQELEKNEIVMGLWDIKAFSHRLNAPQGVYGFIIDDYKERGRNGRDVYGDGVSIDRYYTEWDVRFKFPSSLVHLSEAYWNWALFDPNMSFERDYRINKRAPVQFPVMERAYDNISIIQDVKP